MPYVIVTTDDEAARIGLPAVYIAGPGFTWTGQEWASSLPLAALVQAPGAFLVRSRRP